MGILIGRRNIVFEEDFREAGKSGGEGIDMFRTVSGLKSVALMILTGISHPSWEIDRSSQEIGEKTLIYIRKIFPPASRVIVLSATGRSL